MSKFSLYGEISKTEAAGDGTVKVYGYASSEAVDSDGEVIRAAAIKAALPDYLKFGAVREMHQPKAAGTAILAEVQGDGRLWFGAHVVDGEAIKKVNAGVYKGFSIGGRVTARDAANKAIITGLSLVEISLVDRPANPQAVFSCVKFDEASAGEEGEAVAKAGRRNSQVDQDRIQAVHDHAVSLGAACSHGDAQMAGGAADGADAETKKVEGAKVDGAHAELTSDGVLALVAERDAAMKKADGLSASAETLQKRAEDLQRDNELLKADLARAHVDLSANEARHALTKAELNALKAEPLPGGPRRDPADVGRAHQPGRPLDTNGMSPKEARAAASASARQ